MSQMPIFSYKQYLDDISRMKQTGTIGADQQAESPSSAGSRGLRRTKQFIKDPVHLMGESEEGRPTPAQPNAVDDQSMEEVFESWLQRRIPTQFHEGARHWFEAKYQGRTVPLNKPMRGDVKKSKVYVKDPTTGNVKKVNFGHGGTSAKKLGQKTMKIKKSNPKRRKSFRARHNCANPGPKTKARYWSCKAW
jgi:hypothetical protein|tara:strand:+ start:4262 stop:4837 length:576 start_codon:yes stop_codon:yes gene_type:complete